MPWSPWPQTTKIRAKAGLTCFASDLAREYGFTDKDGRVPDFPRLFDATMREVGNAGPLEGEKRFLAWARYCQIHQDPSRSELAQQLALALDLKDLGPGVGPATAATWPNAFDK